MAATALIVCLLSVIDLLIRATRNGSEKTDWSRYLVRRTSDMGDTSAANRTTGDTLGIKGLTAWSI